MRRSEVCRETGLTKKAVEYYVQRGLIAPAIGENGYREFGEAEVGRLKKIALLRKLDLSLEEIRDVLDDGTGEAMQSICVRRELKMQQQGAKKRLLEQWSAGCHQSEIEQALKSLEESESIAERLLEAFPGYFGRFLCLHFARFLDQPARTADQRRAYQEVITFLDGMPELVIPEELQEVLQQSTRQMGVAQIGKSIEQTRASLEHPEQFVEENRQMLEQYWKIKQQEAYRKSPMAQLQELLRQFMTAQGYYEVFIPAMKRLSPSYAAYCAQLEHANEVLLRKFPQMAEQAYAKTEEPKKRH